MLDCRNQDLNTVQGFIQNGPREDIAQDDLEWYGYDPNVPHYQQPEELNQVNVNDIIDEYHFTKFTLLTKVSTL